MTPRFANRRPTNEELDEQFMGFLFRLSKSSYHFGRRLNFQFQQKKRGGRRGKKYQENENYEDEDYNVEDSDYLEIQKRRGFRGDDDAGAGSGAGGLAF